MIPPEKIADCRRQLKRGYPQGELIQELLDQGHTREEVEAVFNGMVPLKKKAAGEYPWGYVLGWGLVITGISVLAVFSGATLGYFFLLGGGLSLLISFFLEEEKKKFKS